MRSLPHLLQGMQTLVLPAVLRRSRSLLPQGRVGLAQVFLLGRLWSSGLVPPPLTKRTSRCGRQGAGGRPPKHSAQSAAFLLLQPVGEGVYSHACSKHRGNLADGDPAVPRSGVDRCGVPVTAAGESRVRFEPTLAKVALRAGPVERAGDAECRSGSPG